MKRLLPILFLISIALSLIGCTSRNDKVLSSLGKHTKIVYYSDGELQDFTDYAKYKLYAPKLRENEYLKPINDVSTESFLTHLDMYEPFVRDNCSFGASYDFDRGMISGGDYIYIYDDPDYPELGNFSIWFYDSESEILYYFHNNI